MTWPLCFGCHVTYAKKTSFPNSKILRLDEPAKPAPECSDFVFQGRRDTCISAVLASPKIGCDYRGRGAIGEKRREQFRTCDSSHQRALPLPLPLYHPGVL